MAAEAGDGECLSVGLNCLGIGIRRGRLPDAGAHATMPRRASNRGFVTFFGALLYFRVQGHRTSEASSDRDKSWV